MAKGPKMKTHKGAQKRFDVTGTGLIRHAKGMKSHFRRRKSANMRKIEQTAQKESEAKSHENQKGQNQKKIKEGVQGNH